MAVITGDGGDNRLLGAGEHDRIVARAGDDRARGEGGSDRISGAVGNDTLRGGDGRDTLSGGDGNDVLYGHGAGGDGRIRATLIADGLDRPLFATSAPGDPDRLFVVEQHTGAIKILDLETGAIKATPFLDLDDGELATGGEQGLLGFAFHPNFEANGHIFVNLTNAAGDTEVRRYTVSSSNPDVVDPASERVVLTFDQPAANHNGGWLGFGPKDGYLYISSGDGGGAGDPSNNGQRTDTLLGKILRIDVGGDDFPGDPNRNYAIPDDNPFVGRDGADEIWAFGLRNPWRPSFDPATGDLYIADVGQGEFEEVNWQPGSSDGGENYGWKVKEGNIVNDPTVPGNPDPDDPSLVGPVRTYPHGDGSRSVTGGYVLRDDSAGMTGHYFYADFVTSQIWSFRIQDGKAVDFAERTSQILADAGNVSSISSFAVDGDGHLLVIGIDGEIHRLDPSAAAGDGADLISGGAGRDRAFGGVGDDTLNGGGSADTLRGGRDDDRLIGGGNDDRLFGEVGADSVHGGAGDDRLGGGSGADRFLFRPDGGRDTVTDFEDNRDEIRLDGFGFANANQALSVAVEAEGDVVFRFAGGERLVVRNTTEAELANDLLV